MIRFLWGIVLVLLITLPGYTQQEARSLQTSSGGRTYSNPLEQLRERLGRTPQEAPLALEGALDPETYPVGPGDVFLLSIGGGTPLQVPVTVLADGRLLLPDGQSVTVAGHSLAQAYTLIKEALHKSYAHVPVDVALAQTRQFYVHLSGMVPRAGRYLASATTRLEQLLNEAFYVPPEEMQQEASEPPSDFEPSLRNIRIEHRDGSITSVDLVRYYITGDIQQNPYLQDGDRIHVTGYHPRRESVYIDGYIPFAGPYPYRRGDRVSDLVFIGTGGTQTNAYVRLLRSASAKDTLFHVSPDFDPLLQPGDHVFVLTERPEGAVTIEGYVRYPGTYPIVPGHTTLEELLHHAGGLLPDALARGVYIERGPEPTPVFLPNNLPHYPPPPPPLPDTLISTYTHGLKGDFFSRVYLAEQLRTTARRIAVNLEAPSPEILRLPLQDGDRIVVPRNEHTVLVIGRVVRPGFIAYTPDQTVSYYIEAAGGLAPGARTVYLRDAATGRWRKGTRLPVHSGDIIYADWNGTVDNPRVQQLAIQNRNNYLQGIRTALTAIGTATTVITTYLLIRDRLK